MAKELSPHPWFPGVAPGKIHKLVVKRVVVEARKGRSGFGRGPFRVVLTPEGVPPESLRDDGELARWGPGVLEVWAVGERGRFAAGQPHVARYPDARGTVPELAEDFEAPGTAAAVLEAPEAPSRAVQAAPGEGAMVALLTARLADVSRQREADQSLLLGLLDRQREGFAAQVAAIREAGELQVQSMARLGEAMVGANARGGGAASSDALVERVLARMERLEERLDRAREPRVVQSAGAADDSLFGLLRDMGPGLLSYLQEQRAADRERIAVAREALAQRRAKAEAREREREREASAADVGVVVEWDGERIPLPSLAELAERLAEGRELSEEAWEVFRELYGAGKLPPAYAFLLRHKLDPPAR